jgi:hypothetical protein
MLDHLTKKYIKITGSVQTTAAKNVSEYWSTGFLLNKAPANQNSIAVLRKIRVIQLIRGIRGQFCKSRINRHARQLTNFACKRANLIRIAIDDL